MESGRIGERRNRKAKRNLSSNTIKARTISYDGESLRVHLAYKFAENFSEVVSQTNDVEDRVTSDRPVDLFDINRITKNLDIHAISQQIIEELGVSLTKERQFHNEPVYEKENSTNIDEFNHNQAALAGCNIERSLYFRNKDYKLADCQRIFIENKISWGHEDIKTLSTRLSISKSVLYNIKNKRRYCKKISDNLLTDNTKLFEVDELTYLIDKIVMESTIPIKSRDIKDQLQTLYGIHAPIHKILWILKKDLRWSYK